MKVSDVVAAILEEAFRPQDLDTIVGPEVARRWYQIRKDLFGSGPISIGGHRLFFRARIFMDQIEFEISGDTYPLRDILKKYGFWWDKTDKAWRNRYASIEGCARALDRMVKEIKEG